LIRCEAQNGFLQIDVLLEVDLFEAKSGFDNIKF